MTLAEVPQLNVLVVLFILRRKAACAFSLSGQRKGTKRKATLRFARFAGSLRFSPSLAQK